METNGNDEELIKVLNNNYNQSDNVKEIWDYKTINKKGDTNEFKN
jgi:hypothetical protein